MNNGSFVCLCAVLLVSVFHLTLFPAEYGHARDYSWVQGKLVWNGVEGGHWQIYYMEKKAPGLRAEKYRGHFTLGRPVQLKGFKHGEWVRITGKPQPMMCSSYMTGTLYKIKTVKRLGHLPSEPKLGDREKVLVRRAEKMRKTGNRYPDDFRQGDDLKETHDPGAKTRSLLIFPSYYKGRHRPYITEKTEQARGIIEKEVTSTTGSYLGHYREKGGLEKQETIIRAETKDLYHLFTTSAILKTGWKVNILYVIFRPGFVRSAEDRHFTWLGSGGKGVCMGAESLESEEAFTKAGDLISFLIYKNGFLLERSVTVNRESLKWKGLYGIYIKGPVSKKDWRFEYLILHAERKTGKLKISRKKVLP